MDNKLIKVEGEQGIARDLLSGAILSVDKNAFDIWKAKRDKEKQNESRLVSLEEKMSNIELMLTKIMEKL